MTRSGEPRRPSREAAEPRRPSREQAWRIVRSRDRAWDGRLFYAVGTTGIYCRPSCPARRPKPDNVEFFATAEQAEGAGYRACHRCHPKSARGTPTERRIRMAVEFIDAHVDEGITLERLGEAVGLGMTPGEYANGAAGLRIRYSVHATRFGHVIVGWTGKGVCAVMLGDSPDQLVEELDGEFPEADLAPAGVAQPSSSAAAWIRPVLDYLEGTDPGLAVPLDLRGSNFQLRVWNALREIPVGEVRSYGQVAEAIGAPSSARAVARACATNRAALVVPCHRVVRSDGSLSGYRWGEERKRELLEHERRLRGADDG